jgi:glucosyl-3-phosphoglycerate synthase
VTLADLDHRSFDVGALVAAKAGRTTTVCLPARDEAATIGDIVEKVCAHPLVDEALVVDDHSRDATAAVAAAAGARVVRAADVLPEHGSGPGKGQALWKGVAEATGDLIAFCDADVKGFDPGFVTGLLGPLLADPELAFVKAYYRRPRDGQPRGGGRVTELVARPVLHLLFPHLAGVVQPLAGEYAGRRDVLAELAFVEGYGVDLAMLIDVAARHGIEHMAQVDLGERVHRNRPLSDLGPMATVVLMAALRRAGVDGVPGAVHLVMPDLPAVDVRYGERPPLASLPSYRARHGG